jgi:hypothetical protein
MPIMVTRGPSEEADLPRHPSQSWLGATVDLAVVLATSDQAQITVSSFLAFPTGWEFTLEVRAALDVDQSLLGPGFWDPTNPLAAGHLQFGLLFEDGTRALPELPDDGGDIVLTPTGGGSSGSGVASPGMAIRLWVHRTPRVESVAFIYEFPAGGIARSEWRLDGGILAAATNRCVQLHGGAHG